MQLQSQAAGERAMRGGRPQGERGGAQNSEDEGSRSSSRSSTRSGGQGASSKGSSTTLISGGPATRHWPFSVLGLWDKNTGICAGARSYRQDVPATTRM